jgi:hypothetical protein
MSFISARRLAAGLSVIGLTGLSACTPGELLALLGPNGSVPAGASASAQPGGSAGKRAPDPAKDATFTAFKAKVDAAAGDPEKSLKLFIAALVHYEQDATLAKEMMTLVADSGELTEDETSRSGFRFLPARDIYWSTLDRNPALGKAYLQAAGANPEDSVVIDHDYAAIDKGVNGARAKFFVAVGGGKRSRPVSLKLNDGRWQVSEFSSIVVQI